MGRQQIRGEIELGIASRGDVGVAGHEAVAARRVGDPGEPRTPEVVVVQQAVPMGPKTAPRTTPWESAPAANQLSSSQRVTRPWWIS